LNYASFLLAFLSLTLFTFLFTFLFPFSKSHEPEAMIASMEAMNVQVSFQKDFFVVVFPGRECLKNFEIKLL
jgi:hypothetical protein